MNSVIFLWLVMVVVACTVSANAAAPANCKGKANKHPIVDGHAQKLVKTVENGMLYQVLSADLDPPLYVAHVYGTPYEMGKAQGQLVKDLGAEQLFKELIEWVRRDIEKAVDRFAPEWLVHLVDKIGLEAAMLVQYELLLPFIPKHFISEAKGLADGLGMDYLDVIGMQIVPELVQSHCTILGAWGKARQNGGGLVQLRAMDWARDSPLQQKPMVLVFHPSDRASNEFATLTWPIFTGGAMNGISSAGMGISQKVWLRFDGHKSRAGYPFSFLMRDILEFDKSIDEGMTRIINAKRTCSVFMGLGSNASQQRFTLVEYSEPSVHFYGDSTFELGNEANHPQFQDVVYVDKHKQPSSDPCLKNIIEQHYGNFTVDTLFRYVTAQLETGDIHAAAYDFDRMELYVANAGVWNGSYSQPSYERPWTRFSALDLFAVQKKPLSKN